MMLCEIVFKLLGLNTEKIIDKQVPLNENENNFDEKLDDDNYKRKFKNFHDAGWKNGFSTSSDVDMIGCGCGVSQHP